MVYKTVVPIGDEPEPLFARRVLISHCDRLLGRQEVERTARRKSFILRYPRGLLAPEVSGIWFIERSEPSITLC